MIKLTQRLHDSLAVVCPIDGVAILNVVTRQVRVDYQASATAEQRTAAQAVVAGFDWSDDAQKSSDAKARAMTIADDPTVQYILGQINKAAAGYAVPTKESIASDLELRVAVTAK